MRRIALVTLAAVAIALSGCEAGQQFVTKRSLANGILKKVVPLCQPYGGISNIMLMNDADDDGIVTCVDGRHNFYFDA